MTFLTDLLKGFIAGIGGVVPGLSGSVLMVIMGIYEKTIHAIKSLLTNFKKSARYLLPLVLGLGCGVLIFSKLVDFLLGHYEFYTRYVFLGLIIGTIPMFFQEVRKKGFHKRHYVAVVAAAVVGFFVFTMNHSAFAPVENPNLFQSGLMGLAVAGSSIIPGVDGAVILSSLGFYELYVSSVANLNFPVLLPAAVGLAMGGLLFSAVMDSLLSRFYTMTFSMLFGMFLSIIPNILNDSCHIESVQQGVAAVALALLGCLVSFYFADIPNNNRRLRALVARFKK